MWGAALDLVLFVIFPEGEPANWLPDISCPVLFFSAISHSDRQGVCRKQLTRSRNNPRAPQISPERLRGCGAVLPPLPTILSVPPRFPGGEAVPGALGCGHSGSCWDRADPSAEAWEEQRMVHVTPQGRHRVSTPSHSLAGGNCNALSEWFQCKFMDMSLMTKVWCGHSSWSTLRPLPMPRPHLP